MPESVNYACEVCAKTVNDADLKADSTLRRIIINAQVFKSVVATAAVTGPDPSNPNAPPIVVTPATYSIAENNPGRPLVFCGTAHAAAWASTWTW